MSAANSEKRRTRMRPAGFGTNAHSMAISAAAASAMHATPASAQAATSNVVESIASAASGLFTSALATAPALAAVLIIASALPAVALLALVGKRARRSRAASRMLKRAPDRSDTARLAGESIRATSGAFLEIVDRGATARIAIRRDMMQIGRDDDCDIRIGRTSAHRYHAAIFREDIDDWRIADLTGLDGVGVLVNGRRCDDAVLNDGDIIQLGPDRLRFRAGASTAANVPN